MNVDALRCGPYGAKYMDVVVAVEVRMDAALQADLRGALGRGLGHPPGDLLEVQQVGRPPQVQRERALRKSTETAFERADVGVVDVAVVHEGHGIADHGAPQIVGDLGHHPDLGSPGGEQRHDLVVADLLPQSHPVEHLGHRPPVRRPPPTTRRTRVLAPGADQGRWIDLPTGAPGSIAGQALGVGDVEDGEMERRVEPRPGIMRVRGIDGEPCRQHMAGTLRGSAQRVEGRPGTLGVHMVGRDRRDSAPIVDAGVKEGSQVVGQVGRRLNVHLGREHQPGDRDGPEKILGRARRRFGHRRAGLGEEVLDNDLLDVAEPGMGGGDGLESGQLPGPVVADADQDPRGEGDTELTGSIERGESPRRLLVGCAVMSVEVLGQRLDHHSLAGRDRPQRGQLLGEEGSGVGMGEEAGLLQDEATHVDEVVDGGSETVVRQPLLCDWVAQLGTFTQGEEGLVAPGLLAGAGNGQHLVGGEVRGGEAGGRLGEGAVAAAVAAEHGEGDEDLGRVGHPAPVGLVAYTAGQCRQVAQRHL